MSFERLRGCRAPQGTGDPKRHPLSRTENPADHVTDAAEKSTPRPLRGPGAERPHRLAEEGGGPPQAGLPCRTVLVLALATPGCRGQTFTKKPEAALNPLGLRLCFDFEFQKLGTETQ